MERKKVVSSNIKSIGWKKGTLEIEFNTGVIYQYTGVPHDVYNDIMFAKSVGRVFTSQIKGKYDFKVVKDEL